MDYRRFFRQITMLSIATGLLASCSKDNAEEPEPGFISEAVEIAPILSLESESNNSIIYYPGPQDGLDEDLTLFFARADEISAGTYGAYTNMDGTTRHNRNYRCTLKRSRQTSLDFYTYPILPSQWFKNKNGRLVSTSNHRTKYNAQHEYFSMEY